MIKLIVLKVSPKNDSTGWDQTNWCQLSLICAQGVDSAYVRVIPPPDYLVSMSIRKLTFCVSQGSVATFSDHLVQIYCWMWMWCIYGKTRFLTSNTAVVTIFYCLYPIYTMKLARRASFMKHSWSIHEAGFIREALVKPARRALVEPARRASFIRHRVNGLILIIVLVGRWYTFTTIWYSITFSCCRHILRLVNGWKRFICAALNIVIRLKFVSSLCVRDWRVNDV